MNLEALDNLDGSVTFTVSSNSGTAQIWTSRFTGSNASRSFVNSGEIVGNDSLIVELDPGPYVALAVNDVVESSEPIFLRVSDGLEALHYQCLGAVREFMMNLVLPGVSRNPDDHYIVKLPYRPTLELNVENNQESGMFYFPVAESRVPEDNQRDQVTYPVQILMISRLGQKLQMGLNDLLMARQLMSQSFSGCPLPDLEAIHTILISPGSITLPDRWQKSYQCSTVIFRCITEQMAGIL